MSWSTRVQSVGRLSKKEKDQLSQLTPTSAEHEYYLLWDAFKNKKVETNDYSSAEEYFFQSPLLGASKQKLEAVLELFTQTDDVVEGAYKCKNCGSKRTISFTKQIARADEASSNQILCVDCGNKWQG